MDVGKRGRHERRFMDAAKEDMERVGVTEDARDGGEMDPDDLLW